MRLSGSITMQFINLWKVSLPIIYIWWSSLQFEFVVLPVNPDEPLPILKALHSPAQGFCFYLTTCLFTFPRYSYSPHNLQFGVRTKKTTGSFLMLDRNSVSDDIGSEDTHTHILDWQGGQDIAANGEGEQAEYHCRSSAFAQLSAHILYLFICIMHLFSKGRNTREHEHPMWFVSGTLKDYTPKSPGTTVYADVTTLFPMPIVYLECNLCDMP